MGIFDYDFSMGFDIQKLYGCAPDIKRQRAVKQAEYDERQRQRAVKQAEYDERQRQRAVKQAEYDERQRQRVVKQAEYDERQRQRVVKQAEYDERQRQRVVKQAEYDERQRQRVVKQAEYEKTTSAFRKGNRTDIKTAIVLSAPGQCEENANRPAAGQTGKTLQSAINIWHEQSPSEFKSKKLDDYTIINSVEEVFYKKKNMRTEASEKEVCDAINIERVSNLLAYSETVVALGINAQLAVDSSNFEGVIYKSSHPSMQALNKGYTSHKSKSSDRNIDRIEKWAKYSLSDPKSKI